MSSVLHSLDLFTGIGGLTLALQGWVAPVAYCDACDDARAVIAANIKRRALPPAPISDDVRGMGKSWLAMNTGSGRADMIVAGFPCTGMSGLGGRTAFMNDETALFYEMLRVVDEVHPLALFMENSSAIVSLGHKAIGEVIRQLTRREYEVRWTVLGAHTAGAPHRRLRWYCLAVKRPLLGRVLRCSMRVRPFDWTPEAAPPRTVPDRGARYRQRIARLGLAVVPEVARRAFAHLAQGMASTPDDFSRTTIRLAEYAVDASRGTLLRKCVSFPPHGVATPDGRVHASQGVQYDLQRDFKLQIVPGLYRVPAGLRAATPLLAHVLHKTRWNTVIPADSHAAHTLTARSARLLGTQVRYERGTVHRQHALSPEFCEWLMGFPRRWTCTLTPR